MPSSPPKRTWDNKFTIARWWELHTGIDSPQIVHKPELFEQFVKSGDLVFDIGANRGGMTWVFRQLGARVIAVEPLHLIAPERVKEFAWKFRSDPMVTLVPMAIAATPTVELVMPDAPSHWIITSASKRWQTQSAHKHLYNKEVVRQICPAVTIDALIDRYGLPDFIKVDCEGYDGEVISTLTHPVKALNMEFHRDWLWNNQLAMEHLHTLGEYEYNYALDNQGTLVLEEWVGPDVLLAHLNGILTDSGDGSWGDIYMRLKGEQ